MTLYELLHGLLSRLDTTSLFEAFSAIPSKREPLHPISNMASTNNNSSENIQPSTTPDQAFGSSDSTAALVTSTNGTQQETTTAETSSSNTTSAGGPSAPLITRSMAAQLATQFATQLTRAPWQTPIAPGASPARPHPAGTHPHPHPHRNAAFEEELRQAQERREIQRREQEAIEWYHIQRVIRRCMSDDERIQEEEDAEDAEELEAGVLKVQLSYEGEMLFWH